MKTRNILFMSLLVASATVMFAEESVVTNKQPEVTIHIQQDAPKVPAATSDTLKQANEWVEFGSGLGKAFDAGLTSLTDHAEKFSKTDAGHFTMAVIAWKVAGKDATELIHKLVVLPFGIVAEFVWLCVYIWVIRRFCRAYSIKTKETGPFWNRITEYKVVDDFDSNDKMGTMAVATLAFVVVSAIIIGWLIVQ